MASLASTASARAVEHGDAQHHWEEVARAWPDGPAPLWRRQSDEVNRMLLARWLPRGLGRVLKTDMFDEMVGEGLYSVMRSHAERVTAVDLSPRAVSAAAERNPGLEASVGDVLDLPFGDTAFDAVVSNSTLDHLQDREQATVALSELARVLRPGGVLVITLDNPLNPLIAVRDLLPAPLARRLRQVAYDAGWTCGPRSLRELLAESGFAVRELTAVLHFPRVLAAGVDRVGPRTRDHSGWMQAIRAAERLGDWPTRFVTGHFVAALAVRGPGPVRRLAR